MIIHYFLEEERRRRLFGLRREVDRLAGDGDDEDLDLERERRVRRRRRGLLPGDADLLLLLAIVW